MRLITAHRILIGTAIGGSLAFSAWGLLSERAGAWGTGAAVLGLLCAAGLAGYLHAIRKKA